VEVANMSFSFYESTNYINNNKAPLKIAIDIAKDQGGILCIASAGNKGIDIDNSNTLNQVASFPASFPNDNLISVASVNCNLKRSIFSNYGTQSVDITAPGENIWGYDKLGDFITISGTSQATAFVTKVATYLSTFQNNFDWELTKCAILKGAAPLQGSPYVLSNGYIDSAGALSELLSTVPCSFSSSNPDYSSIKTSLDFLTAADNGLQFEINTENNQIANIIIANSIGQILHTEKIELKEGRHTYSIDLTKNHNEPQILLLNVSTKDDNQSFKFRF